MVVKPMIRNNICMNAHPEGLRLHVKQQIEYVKKQKPFKGPAHVLIIGGSAGYGLASRIALAFGAGSGTVSVAYEKPASEKRTATVGWYASETFVEEAKNAGLVAENIYGDAFSNEVKEQTIGKIKELFGTVDLVVYSLASGVRTDPKTGVQYRSVLKPIGQPYHAKSVNPLTGELQEVDIAPAAPEEIEPTVKVMGGEDWELWIDALQKAGVLARGVITLAYSYIGPELTRAVYRDGTIGKAKEHLEATAKHLSKKLSLLQGKAYISVNKAVVTRASAVIPVVPLYLAILFKVMKEKGLHEGCIEQMYRLFATKLYAGIEVPVDEEGRIRMDDWEMREDVQAEVDRRWKQVTQENLRKLSDLEQYTQDFLNLHGFGFPEIDYEKDVSV
ncbi:MAG: trans-2-enoyl-CoA reductase family protein [Spirochaetes bacterium]|nr:trans-2-enoyl-CoA reductase family protein [Spirochaetota bacterium]